MTGASILAKNAKAVKYVCMAGTSKHAKIARVLQQVLPLRMLRLSRLPNSRNVLTQLKMPVVLRPSWLRVLCL